MLNFLDIPKNAIEAYQELQAEVKKVIVSQNPAIREVSVIDNHPVPTVFTEWNEKEKEDDAKLRYNHLLIALTDSEALTGFCNIYADEDLVYEVKDGELLQDKFNLGSHFENLKIEFLEQNLKRLTNILSPYLKINISKAIAMMGEKEQDETIVYKDEVFTYKLQNSELSIRSTADAREIFNKTGFTDRATLEEMNLIMKLDNKIEAVDKLFKKHEQNVKSSKPRL